MAAAQQHIAWAFGTNTDYYEGNLKSGLEATLPHWKMVARGYLKIAGLAATGNNRPDKRASAIEAAYKRHIPLKDHIWLVILPKQLLEDGATKNQPIIDRLNALDINWDIYDWRLNETPDFYTDQITRLVRKQLEAKGQL